jgi:hypothetical protein
MNRQAEVLLLEERYYQENGSLRGFEGFAREWSKANPLQLPQIGSGAGPSLPDQAVGAATETFEDLVTRYAR